MPQRGSPASVHVQWIWALLVGSIGSSVFSWSLCNPTRLSAKRCSGCVSPMVVFEPKARASIGWLQPVDGFSKIKLGGDLGAPGAGVGVAYAPLLAVAPQS